MIPKEKKNNIDVSKSYSLGISRRLNKTTENGQKSLTNSQIKNKNLFNVTHMNRYMNQDSKL